MLFDDPPHTISLYNAASGRDTSGGSTITYTLAQAGIACSINTASAAQRELFSQQQINVSHTIAILSSVLGSTPVSRGMRATDENGDTYDIQGIRTGRAYGSIPAFTYLEVQQQL